MNLGASRQLVQDLFRPKPWIYWVDFLCTVSVAWGSFFLVETLAPFSGLQVLAFLTACFAFYRAVLFIHEISHLKRSAVPYFYIAWNLLAGIPLLFPDFLYRGVHNEHHKRHTYGTAEDAEYLAFGAESPWKILAYLGQIFLIPIPMVLRFTVVAPLSFIHPRVRKFVMEHMSALAIDFVPKRKIPRGRDLTDWYWQELLSFIFASSVAYGFISGRLSTHLLAHWYLQFILLLFINSVRTLAAHRYRHKGGPMSFEEQLLDSVNIEGNVITTELWAPVGLRFHGLHHFFPTMPYHNLGIAHRRLMAQLPADSSYRQSVETSLYSALQTLWRDSSHAALVAHDKSFDTAEIPR